MRLLLVEDDPMIGAGLRTGLRQAGYTADWVQDASAAGLAVAHHDYDAVVLDLGLPDPKEVRRQRELRAWSQEHLAEVAGLSVRTVQRLALDGGANDYVTKPFGIQEFLARVRVLLRLAGGMEHANAAVSSGSLQVDFAYRRVSLDGVEVSLTRKEYAVLAQLAKHIGRVVTQQQLLKDIWGPTHVEDSHYLRVVVGHLRHKLGDDPAAPRFIVTEAGVGYRLREL